MARKSKKEDNVIGAIVLALPVVIFSFFFYKKLSNEYLQSEKVQRVSDIKRLTYPLGSVGVGLLVYGYIDIVLCGALMGQVIQLIEHSEMSSFNLAGFIFLLLVFLIFSFLLIINSYYGAKYAAILYLGILFDFENKRIICPYDFESYGLHDYLSFKC